MSTLTKTTCTCGAELVSKFGGLSYVHEGTTGKIIAEKFWECPKCQSKFISPQVFHVDFAEEVRRRNVTFFLRSTFSPDVDGASIMIADWLPQ